MKIQVQLLNNDASLPIYSTAGAAGCDIFASEDFTIQPTQIKAETTPDQLQTLSTNLATILDAVAFGKIKTLAELELVSSDLATTILNAITETNYNFHLGQSEVNTGVAFGIPIGSNVELELRSKSGLAFKKTIHVFNGTADEDFTNELKILLFNLTAEPITFKKGEKVAQGVFKQIIQGHFEAVDQFNRGIIPNEDRENNPSVQKTIRTDGFGHTGTTQEGNQKL